MTPPTFIVSTPQILRHSVAAPKIATHRRPIRPVHRRPAKIRASAAQQSIPIGSVVAVKRGSVVELAQVTGVSSNGATADLTLLTAFIPELYVPNSEETYEKVADIRQIRSEYVASQNGWIVLDEDLQQAKNYFETRVLTPVVEITPQPKREIDPEALEPQFFPRPTKLQAFVGSALCLPLSVACYYAFINARAVYDANPSGEQLMSGAVFRQIVLFSTGAGSVGAVVIAIGLLLYALVEAEAD